MFYQIPPHLPSELADYLTKQNAYLVMTPMDLDDIASFFLEEEEAGAAAVKSRRGGKEAKRSGNSLEGRREESGTG